MTVPSDHPELSSMCRWLVIATLAMGLALTLARWFDRGRPIALAEPAGARVPCLSYAPFRRAGATPFDAAARVSIEEVERDLAMLRTRTSCVRTYAVSQGLDAVPAVARRLGMRVKLGAWVGRDEAANAAELGRVIALTREHRDVIDLVIVGNEVLLRGELAPDALGALLARVRRASEVPVSYADVWEFWWRHAELRAHVDVVTVHVLPYWEDQPVAVEGAVDHLYAVAARVRQRFGGTPVWVGETGWPAAGRQRGGARPGRVEQARFVRELVARSEREPLDFNLIEGFDQPWKRALEGAMGGAWGLFDSAGAEHFAWKGPVEEDPAWRVGPLAAALAGGIAAVAGALRWRAASSALALGLASAAIAALAVVQWQAMELWNRTTGEWSWSATANAAALLCALAAASRVGALLAKVAAPGLAPGAVRVLSRSRLRFSAGAMLAPSRLVLLFAAAACALQLVFDPRYRALPTPLIAAPALLLLALRVAGERLDRDAGEERVLACAIALCAPLIAFNEGPHNAEALVFVSVSLALAGAVAWPSVRHRRCSKTRAAACVSDHASRRGSGAAARARRENPAP